MDEMLMMLFVDHTGLFMLGYDLNSVSQLRGFNLDKEL